MDYRVKYEQWLNSEVIDKADKEELLSIKDNEKEIDERFYTDLAFGTGGMKTSLLHQQPFPLQTEKVQCFIEVMQDIRL